MFYETETEQLHEIADEIDKIITNTSFERDSLRMNYQLYYYPSLEPDIAVVESRSKEDATAQLEKFFVNVSDKNVFLINCHRKGYVDGIMIISNY